MLRLRAGAFQRVGTALVGLLAFNSRTLATTFFEDFKIVKENPACCNSQFGIGVALQGETAIVGSAFETVSGRISAGAAFVYEKIGDVAWQEAATLTDPNPAVSDTFGNSVSLHGDLALIGAQFDGSSDTGSAFVFRKGVLGNWFHVATLMGNGITAGARFGNSVSIWGNQALVGAIDDDAAGVDSGAAYLFAADEQGNWTQKAALIGNDTNGNDQFGYSVSLFGEYALVGAASQDRRGAAYLFHDDGGGNWEQIAKLVANDLTEFDGFGNSVSISSNRVVVGAAFADSDSGAAFPEGHGAAYIFEPDSGGNWVQVAKLLADDLTNLSHFGFSVSLSSNYVLVGSLGDFNGRQDGAAYLFQRDSAGSWAQIAKLAAEGGAPDHLFFGRSVSLSGSRAIVGANRAAYFYHLVPEPNTMSLTILLIAGRGLGLIRRSR